MDSGARGGRGGGVTNQRAPSIVPARLCSVAIQLDLASTLTPASILFAGRFVK